jgi:beta-lactamase regulating signal transducer with metallopeptidase domain
MLTQFHWQSLAETLAERTLNSLAEGVLIALLTWILLRAVGRWNSSTRFALWFAALAAVVALPVVESAYVGGSHSIHSAVQLPSSWAAYIFVAWMIVAGIGLSKIGFGFLQLRGLRQRCIELDVESLDPVLRNTLAQIGAGRRISICESNEVQVPTAIGFFNLAVVIPSWALDELTPVELNSVLLHEMAHLRRWDDWTNLAQKVLSALLFFHPAIWWIGQSLAREREMACDDFVLAATFDRRGYAQCLVSVAEKSFLRRSLALAQAMAGRVKLTAQRVTRILDPKQSKSERVPAGKAWLPALGLVTAFSAVGLVSLPHVPKLVAFDNGASPSEFAAGDPAAHFGAKIIPAKFTGDVSNLNSFHKTAPPVAGPIKNSKPLLRHAAIVTTAAQLAKPAATTPRFLRARAEDPSVQAAPKAVFVVMQTEQIDDFGRVWNICVWRFTVYHPGDSPVDHEVQKGITPKST